MYFKTILLVILITSGIFAQNSPPQGMPVEPIGKVYGNIIDSKTKQAVPFASVTLKNLRDPKLLNGSLADDDGKFKIEQILPGKYLFKIDFIGYASYTDTLKIFPKNPELNLGTIKLSTNTKELNEVTVVAEKEQMQLGIDRKVFNVDKNAISAGGSATDVLKQIPTINVDIDGKVSIRGSENLTIFINGKPSGMMAQNKEQVLEMIPASTIESIELITNPSAKFDADGMAGILNIITKKNNVAGSFGNLTVGVGTLDKYNASILWNYKKDKFSSTINLGGRINNNYSGGYNLRDNFIKNVSPFSINQYSDSYHKNQNANLSGNIEYAFTDKRTLAFNYMVGTGTGNNSELNKFYFLDNNHNTTKLYSRDAPTTRTNNNMDAGLSYSTNWDEKKKDLSISVNGSFSDRKNNATYTQQNLNFSGEPNGSSPSIQHTTTAGYNIFTTTQADFTLKPNEKIKFETGIKIGTRYIDNDIFADSLFHTFNTYVVDKNITNHSLYTENVNAAYGTISSEQFGFGYQTGLRIEQSNITIEQRANGKKGAKDYLNFFPSIHVMRKLPKEQELQLSYTRRINRPNMEQINPFADYSDPYNIRVGNPDVNPENIDAFEFSYVKYFQKHTLTSTTYFRQTNNYIQRFRSLDSLGVATLTFINLDYMRNYGVELILKSRWTTWWNTSINFNLFQSKVYGTVPQQSDLSSTGNNWNIKANSNFTFWKGASLQISGNYNAPIVFPQGSLAAMWNVDAGIRKELLKGKLAITANITDIFDSRRFSVHSVGYDFDSHVLRKRESRIFTVNLTWKFGSPGNLPERKPKRDNRQNDSGNDMDMGM